MVDMGEVLTNRDQVPDVFIEVFDYWNRSRGDAAVARWGSFRLEDLPPKILPWSIVVDVEPGAVEFRFRFWGTKRTSLIGVELTGALTSAIPHAEMREGNVREYQEVFRIGKPMLFDTPIVKGSGINTAFQSLRLPLTDDGESISKIYSALNYEKVLAEHYKFFGTDR